MLLVLATKNQGKIREIEKILALPGLEFRSLMDYPYIPDVLEDGQTFLENALKKAELTALATGQWTLADDSGLEIEALGGAPGVRSARFSAPRPTDAKNNLKVLRLLASVPPKLRTARFVCVMVLVRGGRVVGEFRGEVRGRIALEPRGLSGFGYDPIFRPDGYDITFGGQYESQQRSLQEVYYHILPVGKFAGQVSLNEGSYLVKFPGDPEVTPGDIALNRGRIKERHHLLPVLFVPLRRAYLPLLSWKT